MTSGLGMDYPASLTQEQLMMLKGEARGAWSAWSAGSAGRAGLPGLDGVQGRQGEAGLKGDPGMPGSSGFGFVCFLVMLKQNDQRHSTDCVAVGILDLKQWWYSRIIGTCWEPVICPN